MDEAELETLDRWWIDLTPVQRTIVTSLKRHERLPAWMVTSLREIGVAPVELRVVSNTGVTTHLCTPDSVLECVARWERHARHP